MIRSAMPAEATATATRPVASAGVAESRLEEFRVEIAEADRAVKAASQRRVQHLEAHPELVRNYFSHQETVAVVQFDPEVARLHAALADARRRFHAALAAHAEAKRRM